MTPFQMLAVAVFVVVLLMAYGKEVATKAWASLRKLWPKTSILEDTPAQELVDDLVTVAALRDKLAADGCKDGADACTILLRILVEFRPKS